MLNLSIDREPRWIDLHASVRVLVAPMRSAVMLAIRSDIAASDLPRDNLDEMHAALVKGAARHLIQDWQGVGDEHGEPLEVSPAAVDALMDLHKFFQAFDSKVVGPYLELQAEKNVSAPSLNGTSAGAGPTARPARKSARPAREK